MQGWIDAFPDVQGTVARAVADGDAVVLEIDWTGTQTGSLPMPSGVLAPSGKRITVASAMLMTLGGDRIQTLHHYFDLLTILAQIGAVPAPA